jgi:hypothetical protein
MEQSRNVFLQMQEQLQNQTRNMFPGFTIPGFGAPPGGVPKPDGDKTPGDEKKS